MFISFGGGLKSTALACPSHLQFTNGGEGVFTWRGSIGMFESCKRIIALCSNRRCGRIQNLDDKLWEPW